MKRHRECHTIVTRCESKTTSRIHRSLFHHRLKSTLSKNIGSLINNRCDAEQSVENRVTRDTKSHAFYIIYLSLEPYSRPFNGLNDSRRRVNRNVWLILPPIIARVSRGGPDRMSNNRHNQQRRCCYPTVVREDRREKCEKLRFPNVAVIIAAGESAYRTRHRADTGISC